MVLDYHTLFDLDDPMHQQKVTLASIIIEHYGTWHDACAYLDELIAGANDEGQQGLYGRAKNIVVKNPDDWKLALPRELRPYRQGDPVEGTAYQESAPSRRRQEGDTRFFDFEGNCIRKVVDAEGNEELFVRKDNQWYAVQRDAQDQHDTREVAQIVEGAGSQDAMKKALVEKGYRVIEREAGPDSGRVDAQEFRPDDI